VSNLVAPRGTGASEAVVMHLSKNSLKPAFVADVAAKESNQDRLLGLLLMPARIGLIFWVGTNAGRAWSVAALLSALHLALNAMAVKVLVLKTFNRERLRHVLEAWEGKEAPDQLSPAVIAGRERLIPGLLATPDWSLKLGVPLDQALVPHEGETGGAEGLRLLLDLHSEDGYVLGACMKTRQLRGVLKEGAGDEAQLMACLHAHKVAQLLKSRDQVTLASVVAHVLKVRKQVQAEWPKLQRELQHAGWRTDCTVICADEWRLLPCIQAARPHEEEWRQHKPRGAGEYVERCWRIQINGSTTALSEQAVEKPAEGSLSGALVGVKSAVLPRGYPVSVADEYMEYQLWDTLQVMMADLRSIVISQAGLLGLGVGSADASPLGVVHTDAAVEVLGTLLGLMSGMSADPRGMLILYPTLFLTLSNSRSNAI